MKLRLHITLLLTTLASAAWLFAQESLPGDAAPGESAPAESIDAQDPLASAPPTDARHYSYAIGLDIGSSFKNDGLKFDPESLLAGVRDGLAGGEPRYSAQLCAAAVQRLAQERAGALLARARAFLAENAKQKGVKVTRSGLQYKILKSGAGPSPTAASTVKAHYRGTFTNGEMFDASPEGEPATFSLRRVIPGWTEALQLMKVGDKWQLFVPPELAYGPEGFGDDIPPNAALIFEVELVGVE